MNGDRNEGKKEHQKESRTDSGIENTGRLKRLFFLLSGHSTAKERPDAAGGMREKEVDSCRDELEQCGIAVRKAYAADSAELEWLLGQEIWRPKDFRGTLFLTDAGWIHKRLLETGYYSIGYLHSGNEKESFEGAAFIVAQPEEIDLDSYEKIWQRAAGLPWTIARTERLVLREMTMQDLDDLYALYEDETAQRYLGLLSEDRSKEAQMLEAYIRRIYPFYGYGMWAVCCKKTGEMIGRAGLSPCRKGQEMAELGYLIRKDLRNRGLAKEAATAVLSFARKELGMERVALYTERSNAASRALAKSLGFWCIGAAESERTPGAEHLHEKDAIGKNTIEEETVKKDIIEEWRLEWND